MKEFSEYEKMARTWNLKEDQLSEYSKLKKGLWVATEKIHGANFSVVWEDGKVRYAKRKGFLNWDDDFFGFQLEMVRIEKSLLDLFDCLRGLYAAKRYCVYGELMGGEYPHPDVPKVVGLQAIQTGIYYSPEIRFCIFDIAIENEKKVYVDYREVQERCIQFQLLHARPLKIGTLEEVMNFPLRTNSIIPAQLGLPPLSNNIMEGIVIKPWEHNDLGISERPIFKIKNPEFDEEEKFHESVKWSINSSVKTQAMELEYLWDSVLPLLNDIRIQSAVSKIGPLTLDENRRNELVQEINSDIWVDFEKYFPGVMQELSDQDRDWISARLKSEIEVWLSRN